MTDRIIVATFPNPNAAYEAAKAIRILKEGGIADFEPAEILVHLAHQIPRRFRAARQKAVDAVAHERIEAGRIRVIATIEFLERSARSFALRTPRQLLQICVHRLRRLGLLCHAWRDKGAPRLSGVTDPWSIVIASPATAIVLARSPG